MSDYITPSKNAPVFILENSYSGMEFSGIYKQWQVEYQTESGSCISWGYTAATNYVAGVEVLHETIIEEYTQEFFEGMSSDFTFTLKKFEGKLNRHNEVVFKTVYKLTKKQILDLLF